MIRKMTAEDDPSAVADLICEADGNFVGRLFGDTASAAGILSILVCRESGLFGHRNIWVHTSDIAVDGILLGFNVRDLDEDGSKQMYAECMSPEACSRFSNSLGFLKDPIMTEKDVAYVLTLAVSKESRRKGIAGDMVRVFAEDSKKNGHPVISLDVSSDKEGSILFYEKMGFRTVGEIAVSPVLTYKRMEL